MKKERHIMSWNFGKGNESKDLKPGEIYPPDTPLGRLVAWVDGLNLEDHRTYSDGIKIRPLAAGKVITEVGIGMPGYFKDVVDKYYGTKIDPTSDLTLKMSQTNLGSDRPNISFGFRDTLGDKLTIDVDKNEFVSKCFAKIKDTNLVDSVSTSLAAAQAVVEKAEAEHKNTIKNQFGEWAKGLSARDAVEIRRSRASETPILFGKIPVPERFNQHLDTVVGASKGMTISSSELNFSQIGKNSTPNLAFKLNGTDKNGTKVEHYVNVADNMNLSESMASFYGHNLIEEVELADKRHEQMIAKLTDDTRKPQMPDMPHFHKLKDMIGDTKPSVADASEKRGPSYPGDDE
jgi:hypothetical protein